MHTFFSSLQLLSIAIFLVLRSYLYLINTSCLPMHFTSTVYTGLFFLCLDSLMKRTLFPPSAAILAWVTGYNTTHVSTHNVKNFDIYVNQYLTFHIFHITVRVIKFSNFYVGDIVHSSLVNQQSGTSKSTMQMHSHCEAAAKRSV